MKLGNKITSRRKELGLTQQELADKLSVSVKTVNEWETNRGIPEMDLLPLIAKHLEINKSKLFEEVKSQKKQVVKKHSQDIIYACFEFGFAFLSLIFFATTYFGFTTTLHDISWGGFFGNNQITYNFSGYKVLFSMYSTNFLGFLLILSVWVTFLSILAHIAMGVIELKTDNMDIIDKRNKWSFIISIIEVSAVGVTLLLSLVSSFTIGFGLIMMLLLSIFILGYNIYYKKRLLNN